MRRARLVKPILPSDSEKASIEEALWFDLRAPDTSGEAALSDWRVATLEHAPLLLGVTHLLIALTCVLLSRDLQFCWCVGNPALPAVLVVVLDAAAATALYMRDRFNFSPHKVVRALCV